jgi:DNA-directed RNA polymerase subunit RPC12/RpoP
MSDSSVTISCSNCGREHDLPAGTETDDEIICPCGNLIFPSDYGLTERGYSTIKMLYLPEAN